MISWTIHRDCRGKAGNQREHHMAKWRRQQSERAATQGSAMVQLRREGLLRLAELSRPVIVRLTRIGKRRLDTDNVVAALATVRDEVARMLGVTDGPTDQRVSWEYGDQELGEYAVRVEVRSAETV